MNLKGIIRPDWTVWDCGIYLGYYTCFFARLVGSGGRCIAFEPDPRNLKRAEANAELNGFRNIVFKQVAIAGASGTVEFVFSDNTNSHISGAYIGVTEDAYRSRELISGVHVVNSASLGDLLQRDDVDRPHLIKIDIEGAELDVLSLARPEAWTYRPLLVVELHNPQCDAALWDFARRFGYELKDCETMAPINEKQLVRGCVFCSPRNAALAFPPASNR